MNEEYISIKKLDDSNHIPCEGERTLKLVNEFEFLDQEGKDIVINEAQDILRHCIFPNERGTITNIAVGYVQSGKTLSFTVLTALAADNGFRVIIYLTGTKTNLADQTYKRLNNDLNKNFDRFNYKIFKDGINVNNDVSDVKKFLEAENITLLFPIMKHSKHIDDLTKIFKHSSISSLIQNKGVLIIDDEADQSSFNTYARKNSNNPDWESNDYSRTYSSILNLKNSLPNHSYIQYTATPQAAFLVDNADVLSPKYHTVLTPGKGYTGGKYFFKENRERNIVIIPDKEVYHFSRNPLKNQPESLKEALREFLISVALVVYIQKREPYLSMMVHIDGRKSSNSIFYNWIKSTLSSWADIFKDINNPGRNFFISDLKKSYENITKYSTEKSSFEEICNVLKDVFLWTQTYLIQGDTDNDIEWKDNKANILVGADMLNRGFTVEKLSMSYMPRTTKGKPNADTIEQRCRFFGYKENISDIIRIFIPQKSMVEFSVYVDHEEILRSGLIQCKTVDEFCGKSRSMVLDYSVLSPTRTNILSKKIISNKMSGWRQMRAYYDGIHKNVDIIDSFFSKQSNLKLSIPDNNKTDNRLHRYTEVDIDTFIELFKLIHFRDMPNIARKCATIQYLSYIKDNSNISTVVVFQMASSWKQARERSFENDVPKNLQEGRSVNYKGDRLILVEDKVCIQFFKIKPSKDMPTAKYLPLPFYNIAIYYPKKLGEGFISLDNDEEDEDDE